MGKAEHDQILAYLVSNAGSGKIAANNNSMRITESPKFIKEHREVPARLITQKEFGSLSNCGACHTWPIKAIIRNVRLKYWEITGDGNEKNIRVGTLYEGLTCPFMMVMMLAAFLTPEVKRLLSLCSAWIYARTALSL